MAGWGKYTPRTFLVGNSGPANYGPQLLWEGYADATKDLTVQVWETPASTGDNMTLRVVDDAGAFLLNLGISPKDSGWTSTWVMRWAGNPVNQILTGDNSGSLPAPGQRHISVYVYMSNSDNPTTWVMADVSVRQSGRELVPSLSMVGEPGGGLW